MPKITKLDAIIWQKLQKCRQNLRKIMKNMVSATGAWRCKIFLPSFWPKRARFWLHFGVRGGHWLDGGRLFVQKRRPKSHPEIGTKNLSKIHTKTYPNDAKMDAKFKGFSTFTAKGIKARNYCIYNRKRGSRHPEINPKSLKLYASFRCRKNITKSIKNRRKW